MVLSLLEVVFKFLSNYIQQYFRDIFWSEFKGQSHPDSPAAVDRGEQSSTSHSRASNICNNRNPFISIQAAGNWVNISNGLSNTKQKKFLHSI